ncbi:MAG: VIT domain-containing protein [Bacteroidota bacterium]
MNPLKRLLLLFLCSLSVLSVAQEPESQVLAPYFMIPGNDSKEELMPVKSISADVTIAGTIADVRLSQVFVNRGQKPIEAIYVFPGSTQAAVYGMEMHVGGRKITAEIAERKLAREKYKRAKENGKRASLLEQNRPNVFQMNVANIMPGDTIRVLLSYTELITPEEGKYKFVLPTTVGPRYSSKLTSEAPSQDEWVRNPYLSEGEQPGYSFDINVNLLAGVPIQDIRCASHNLNMEFTGETNCWISLAPSSGSNGNRDFILEYYLRGRQVETGILTYKGNDENFFLMMVEPPKKLSSHNIPPREYVFVVDVSGSMHGFPLNVAKDLMEELLQSLNPYDRFNVVLFEYGSKKLYKRPQQASQENIENALRMLRNKSGGGGTNLYKALEPVILEEPSTPFARSVIVVTDGYIDAEKEVFELISDNLNKTNVFAFGIGSSVNRYLIEGLAKCGKGEPFIVTQRRFAREEASKFIEYINKPALTNIAVNFGNNDVYDVSPKQVPDVFADRPVVIVGKYEGELSDKIQLTGVAGSKRYVASVSPAANTNELSALKFLWARDRVSNLVDFQKPTREMKREVITLGLTYSLLTEYTSFVAIDDAIGNPTNSITSVKQPLPLPSGVSNYAVGGGNWNWGRLNATGAVLRALASPTTISILAPSSNNIVNDRVLLKWSSTVSGPYEVQVKNIYDRIVYSEDTEFEDVWLDLNEFLNPNEPLFILSVRSIGDGDGSGDLAFQYKPDMANQYLPEVSDKRSEDFYINLASYYEGLGLFVDAISAFEMGLIHYPEGEDIKEKYDEFLKDHGVTH